VSKKVNIISDHVISALGNGSKSNFDKLIENQSGVRIDKSGKFSPNNLPLGSINDDFVSKWKSDNNLSSEYSRFETLCVLSVSEALKDTSVDISSKDTLLVLSTTKGNIDLIDKHENLDKLNLWYSAKKIAEYFNAANTPKIISNACMSGVAAILYANWHILAGNYKHAVVVGADILSKFVVSGFESFKSLSSEICKPFDRDRDGLTMGEAAATVVLSLTNRGEVSISKGATANDANHISGPSRTGEGLFQAINHILDKNDSVDFISAHGTATPFNDDMESVAFHRAGLNTVPVNSFKGYVGHTLGAAGVVEIIFSIWSMKNNTLIKTYGYKNFGVKEKINIIDKNYKKDINNVLKVASGFGGCNVAMLLEKND